MRVLFVIAALAVLDCSVLSKDSIKAPGQSVDGVSHRSDALKRMFASLQQELGSEGFDHTAESDNVAHLEEQEQILANEQMISNNPRCTATTRSCQFPGAKSSSPKVCINPTGITDDTHSSGQQQPVTRSNYPNRPTDNLDVHTLPVGQGDCTVIFCPNKEDAVLFDCGSSSRKAEQIRLSPGQVRSYFRQVNHITIMLSHGHTDHYNYIPNIFNEQILNSKIRQIYIGGNENEYWGRNTNMKNWLKDAKEKGKIPVNNAIVGKDLNLCRDTKIHFRIISVNAGTAKNQKSIVMKLYHDNYDSIPLNNRHSLLFNGDMEGTAAKNLATTEPYKSSLSSTHYKVSHHGASSQANQREWLTAIYPIEAHISNPFIGSYGHPRCEAIQRIMSYGRIGLTNPTNSHPVHPLTCFNSRKKTDFDTVNICHRIYSTSPNGNEACVIALSFRRNLALTYYFCGNANAWQTYFGNTGPSPDKVPGEDED